MITVKPDKGYVLDELVITDKKGNEIDCKAKGDNKFTFKMPASKVEIEATFAPEKAEECTIVLTIVSIAASVFGNTVINVVDPIARHNRTMLPIRFIAEALGATVAWEPRPDRHHHRKLNIKRELRLPFSRLKQIIFSIHFRKARNILRVFLLHVLQKRSNMRKLLRITLEQAVADIERSDVFLV